MLNFGTPADEGSNDLIPANTLVYAYMNVRGLKLSRKGGQYIDMELTIAGEQPYAKRKVWDIIMDPGFAANSPEAKNMGLMKIRRIFESAILDNGQLAFGSTPDRPESYSMRTYEDFNGGKMIPIKITIRKQKDHDDKNNVEVLSPYSSSKNIVAAYNALKEGKHSLDGDPNSAQQNGFAAGAGAQPPVQNTQAAPAGSPQQGAAPSWMQGGNNQPTSDDIPFG